MGNTLVFLEQQKGELPKSTLSALRAAKEVAEKCSGGDLIGVCLGEGAKKAAAEAQEFGLKAVYVSEEAAFAQYRAVPYAAAVCAAGKEAQCTRYVAAATTTGKDFFPRITATLEASQASDILEVKDDGTFVRPMYAGDVLAHVRLAGDVHVITARATAFDPAEKSSPAGELKDLTVTVAEDIAGKVVNFEASGGDRPELTEADVVVSGGRALKSKENFEKYIFPLADALGAAVGASRAAVDSGYAPNDWQVGQTGKVVAPNLYIALGISGAIQHIAGMKDSKTIVAINSDEEAPIFELADYGLVADLYEVIEPFTEKIKGL